MDSAVLYKAFCRELDTCERALRLMLDEHVVEVERADPARAAVRQDQWARIKAMATDVNALRTIRDAC